VKRNSIRRWASRLLFLVFAAGAGALALWFNQNRSIAADTNRQLEFKEIKRGDLAQTITATGELTPVTKVEVGSQISGIIQNLYVDFNSSVKAGQVIVKLDPATYEANLLRADGDLDNAKADLELARINERRAGELRREKLNPQADYDVALADLHKAEAAVKIAEGSFKKAQVDLARCTIYSPIDGMVVLRNVDVGQTVAASLSAPVLMLIANDLSKMQIEANVVEADIGQVREGQKVEFHVDAYPGEKFKGVVTQVRNAPREEMNVVVYRTIIQVSNPELKLKPGMTATVAVIVASRDDVLKIPNTALRFKPPKGTTLVEDNSVSVASTGPYAPTSKKDSASSSKSRDKSASKATRKVFVLPAGTVDKAPPLSIPLRTVDVQCGITDGSYTEVLAGLNEGDRVVTGTEKVEGPGKLAFNPFAFLNR
jgi:HlyD family secretion protein